jgi:hypothetical protein
MFLSLRSPDIEVGSIILNRQSRITEKDGLPASDLGGGSGISIVYTSMLRNFTHSHNLEKAVMNRRVPYEMGNVAS